MAHREDWLLLALARKPDKPFSPVQVQKAMFLMRAEAGQHLGDDFYEFTPYNYGPFSAEIYRDLEKLSADGMVIIDGGNAPWRTYQITKQGARRGDELRPQLDATIVTYLDRVVDWVTSLSFIDLVRSIYAKYPAYKVNSVFVDNDK